MRKSASQEPIKLNQEHFELLLMVLLFKLAIPAKYTIDKSTVNLKKSLLTTLSKKAQTLCEKILDINQRFADASEIVLKYIQLEKKYKEAVSQDEIKNLKNEIIRLREIKSVSKIIGLEEDDLFSIILTKYPTNTQDRVNFIKSILAYGRFLDLEKPLVFLYAQKTYTVNILDVAAAFGVWKITNHYFDLREKNSSQQLKDNPSLLDHQFQIKNHLSNILRKIPNSNEELISLPTKKAEPDIIHLGLAGFMMIFGSVDRDRYESCAKTDYIRTIEILRRAASKDEKDLQSLAKEKICPRGSTALSILCFHQMISEVEKLIKAGANLNDEDHFGITPLTSAIFRNNLALVSLLLSYGAKIDTSVLIGHTDMAFIMGHFAILKLLLSQKKNTEKTSLRFYEWANDLIHCGAKEISILNELLKLNLTPKIANVLQAISLREFRIFEWYLQNDHWKMEDYLNILHFLVNNRLHDFCDKMLKTIDLGDYLDLFLEFFVSHNKPELALIFLQNGANPESVHFKVPLLEIAILLKSSELFVILLPFVKSPPSFAKVLKSGRHTMIKAYLEKFPIENWGTYLEDWHQLLGSKPGLKVVRLLVQHMAPLERYHGYTALARALQGAASVKIIQELLNRSTHIENHDIAMHGNLVSLEELVALHPNAEEIKAFLKGPTNEAVPEDKKALTEKPKKLFELLKSFKIPDQDIATLVPSLAKLPPEALEQSEILKAFLSKRKLLLSQLSQVKSAWYSGINLKLELAISEHDKHLTCAQLQDKIVRFEQKIQLRESQKILTEPNKISIFSSNNMSPLEVKYCKDISYQLFQNSFTLLDCPFTLNSQILCDQLDQLVHNFKAIPREQLLAFERKIQRAKLVSEGSGIKSLGACADTANYSAELELSLSGKLRRISLPVLFEVKIRNSKARILIGVLEPDSPGGKKLMIPCCYLENGLHLIKEKKANSFKGGLIKFNEESSEDLSSQRTPH